MATSFDRVAVKPATVTYARREVTLSGRLLGRWPGDGHIEPLAGFPVNLSSYPGDFGVATTLADGTFSGPLHLDDAGSVYAYYSYDNDHIGHLSGNSAELPVGITPTSARATVTANRAKVKAGEKVTLTGQLTWRSPDGWRPFANKQFGVLFCYAESACPWLFLNSVESACFEDERLDSGEELGTSRILREEIERPRVGPMRDIVATIQPEQDELVRAELDESICAQGAPATPTRNLTHCRSATRRRPGKAWQGALPVVGAKGKRGKLGTWRRAP